MMTAFRVPANLVGEASSVAADLAPRVAAFIRGGAWRPYSDDRASVQGLVVMNGPSPLLAEEVHTHVWMALKLLADQIVLGSVDATREQEVFDLSLADPVGILGLLAPCNQLFLYPPGRLQPIADALRRQWTEFESVGLRYTVGLVTGDELWNLPTNLQYVLGNLGVDPASLAAPLPPGGIEEILGRVDRRE